MKNQKPKSGDILPWRNSSFTYERFYPRGLKDNNPCITKWAGHPFKGPEYRCGKCLGCDQFCMWLVLLSDFKGSKDILDFNSSVLWARYKNWRIKNLDVWLTSECRSLVFEMRKRVLARKKSREVDAWAKKLEEMERAGEYPASIPERVTSAQSARFLRAERIRLQACTCCTKADISRVYKNARWIGAHVDHRVALALGGKHCVHNLQILSVYDHRRKTAVDMQKIAAAKRFTLSVARLASMC